jgi:hypothetical protein
LPQNLRVSGEHFDNVQQSNLPKDDEFSSVSQKQRHEFFPVLNHVALLGGILLRFGFDCD